VWVPLFGSETGSNTRFTPHYFEAGFRKSRNGKDLGKPGRHDLNVRTPAPKAEGNAHETNENRRFPAQADDVSADASPISRNNETESTSDSLVEGGLAAALSMIERLPLSDGEKAEAVRRLLGGRDA
jgi:hypothetical protein